MCCWLAEVTDHGAARLSERIIQLAIDRGYRSPLGEFQVSWLEKSIGPKTMEYLNYAYEKLFGSPSTETDGTQPVYNWYVLLLLLFLWTWV